MKEAPQRTMDTGKISGKQNNTNNNNLYHETTNLLSFFVLYRLWCFLRIEKEKRLEYVQKEEPIKQLSYKLFIQYKARVRESTGLKPPGFGSGDSQPGTRTHARCYEDNARRAELYRHFPQRTFQQSKKKTKFDKSVELREQDLQEEKKAK